MTSHQDEARVWGRDNGRVKPQDKAVKARSQPNSLHLGDEAKSEKGSRLSPSEQQRLGRLSTVHRDRGTVSGLGYLEDLCLNPAPESY